MEGESEQESHVRKTPGVEYRPKPIEINGEFYNGLHPPKIMKTPDGREVAIGGERLDKDQVYAERFWGRNQPKGLREVMMDNIRHAAEERGIFSSFVTPSGIKEEDRERLSAHRVLAKEMGYEIGQFQFDRNSHAASAPITRIDQKAPPPRP